MFGDYKIIGTLDDVTGERSIAGAFKIAENESPLPQDRLFVNYNFFSKGVKGIDRTHYETIGVEKTLLSEDFSLGLRIPFFQWESSAGETVSGFGDVSVILKYAALGGHRTGDALSLGLAVTTPTSSKPHLRLRTGKEIHSTLLQPFIGYLWNWKDFFIHGFASVVAPTDSRDLTFLFNDIGIGYWVYRAPRNQLLSGIIPTFEIHVNTPLDNRGAHDVPRFQDIVDLTGGVTFALGQKSSLGVAVGIPVTGPRQFDVEAIANLNWRF
jgi:hypothetical protein